MPSVSGNVGAVFNGGTVTLATSLDPASAAATALTITAPTGAAALQTDEFNIVDEHGAFILESDAAGNFLWFIPVGTAVFSVTDVNGVRRIDAAAQTQTVVRAPVGGVALLTDANTLSGVSVTDSGHIGFFGSAGAARPTVTGAKLPSDTVMASLLTALAALGLVTNSTT